MKIFILALYLLFNSAAFAGGKMPFLQFSMPSLLGPVPRLITKAYFSQYNGPLYTSPGMSQYNFSVSTAGVQNGDLLIFVGTVDNGNDTAWPNPISSGFTQLSQKFYGNDGQTVVVSWKIANNEPVVYTGSYPSTYSGSVTIALIAISGHNAVTPIGTSNFTYNTGTDTATVDEGSTGVTTTTANNLILYMSGADWKNQLVTISAFNLPSGFSSLVQFGDHGDNTLDWSSIMIGYKYQASAGATGALTANEVGSKVGGLGWSAVIPIQP